MSIFLKHIKRKIVKNVFQIFIFAISIKDPNCKKLKIRHNISISDILRAFCIWLFKSTLGTICYIFPRYGTTVQSECMKKATSISYY
jgi:hypothetical protein